MHVCNWTTAALHNFAHIITFWHLFRKSGILFILWCFVSLQNHIAFAEVTWRGVGRVADPLGVHALHSPSSPTRMLRQPFLCMCSSARLPLTALRSPPMHHLWDLVWFSPPFDVGKRRRRIFALLPLDERVGRCSSCSWKRCKSVNPENPESCNDQAQTGLICDCWSTSWLSRSSELLRASVCDHNCRMPSFHPSIHPSISSTWRWQPVKLLHWTSDLVLKPSRVPSITHWLLHVLSAEFIWTRHLRVGVGPPHGLSTSNQRFIFYSKDLGKVQAWDQQV